MCGIVGTLIFKNSNFTVTKPYITKMRDTMAHRGPDGAGVWVSEDGRIGFGHRRLSIIDLSETATQPMCNEDGTVWIVFNGEIYNFKEIRKDLEKKGHKFISNSDTEAIIHGYEEYGLDILKKLNGMVLVMMLMVET